MISDGKNTLLKIGYNGDVISCWKSVYEEYKDQPRDLVKKIRYGSVDDQCQAIFRHLCEHVYYKLDTEGDQYIKTPARLIDDGCGDCKSLTMFIACCLHCLGIPFIVRFVNFDGGEQYTHVYPVAIDEYGNEIVLDYCETDEDGIPYYDYARPYKKKKDLIYG